MSIAVKVVLAILVLALLEMPAVVAHSALKSERAVSADYKKKYEDDERSIGLLQAQLATSQSDLKAAQLANRVATASVDLMKSDADNAASAAAAYRLSVAVEQATAGSVIKQRDAQIASLKAQKGGCDEAIADLRSGK